MERPVFKLWSDNTGNIRKTQNPCQRAATKHIEIADHFIREQCDKGRVTVTYVDTKDMVADIFTKALGRELFIKQRITGQTGDDDQEGGEHGYFP